MDLAPNFVAFIDAIIWPTTLLFILFKFRNSINELINRVVNDSHEIEIMGLSARFSETKEKLSSLDLSSTDKETMNNAFEDFALSQLKEISKLFFTAKYPERQVAAAEVAKIGLELRAEQLIDLAESGTRGERTAAAIALKEHMLKDPAIIEDDRFRTAVDKGLKNELSRVRFRFIELVLASDLLLREYSRSLKLMKTEDPNEAVRELVRGAI